MDAGKGEDGEQIAGLSVYRAEWKLTAKVWKKSKIQQWKNDRSHGKLFHANLIDSQGDEISCTFFNSAVDQFYPFLLENHQYRFSKGKILKSNPKFRTTSSDLHINFDIHSEITEILDESQEIPTFPVKFTPLATIPGLISAKNTRFVDVCGVIIEKGTVFEVISRCGDKIKKREVVICDKTEFPMKLTLWGDEAEMEIWENAGKRAILLLVLKAQVCVFRENLILTTNMTATKVIINPGNCPEADLLLEWKKKLENVEKKEEIRANSSIF